MLLSLGMNVQSFTPSSSGMVEKMTTNNANGFGQTMNTLIQNNVIRMNKSRNYQSISQLNVKKASTEVEEKEEGGFLSNLKINPPYAIAYLLFIAIAAYMSTTEPAGASQALIEQFIADPVNPGYNELFLAEFNALGLIGIPMACLVMPGAKGQSLPAPPFLIASSFAGYGGLGIYMSTRKAPDVKDNTGIGFVTKNILENKIFNWLIFGFSINNLFVSGAVSAFMNDSQALFSGYTDFLASSALGSVSTVDFAILTLTAASLIPEDLARRGVTDGNKANAIALSTCLFPVIGSCLYCALRPSLPEE